MGFGLMEDFVAYWMCGNCHISYLHRNLHLNVDFCSTFKCQIIASYQRWYCSSWQCRMYKNTLDIFSAASVLQVRNHVCLCVVWD